MSPLPKRHDPALSPWDDYPLHQISEPIRHVGTSDPNFYDRYYFNIHGRSGELFAVIGYGQYPNLSIADAFLSVMKGDDHRLVRASKTMGADRVDASIGPIRIEVVEGLRKLRVVVEENEWGVSMDAVFDATCQAVLEPRHFDRQFTRVTFDSTRFAQNGSWEGTLTVGDETVQLTPDRWMGSRDRSWGVRPVGEGEAPGIRATDEGHGFFWIYAPVDFGDHSLVTIVQEDPDGRRIMEDAQRVFGVDDPRPPEPLGIPEHDVVFREGTRFPERATLSYYGRHGALTARIEVEPLADFPLMMGTGYGLEADWRFGKYVGELVVDGKVYDTADPSYQPWGLFEHPARFTYLDGTDHVGKVGYGMFEFAVLGPHERYGFTGW